MKVGGDLLFNILEMFLFVTASLYVANHYIKSGDNMMMFFGLFLIWIFIDKVTTSTKKDANQKETAEVKCEK